MQSANSSGALAHEAFEVAADIASARADLFAWLSNQWAPTRPFEAEGFAEWRSGWDLIAGAVGDEGEAMTSHLDAVQDEGQALLREHDALFVTRAGFYTSPVESVYVGARQDELGWSLGRLRGHAFKQVKVEYARDGFDPGRALDADHVTCELRYLAALCGAEAQAFAAGDFERARQLRARESTFLEEHLLNWLPILSRKLSGSDEDTFFRHACAAFVAYLEVDGAYLRQAAS